EQLTGVSAAEARGLRCANLRPAEPGSIEEMLAHALAPSREVMQGRTSSTRRLLPGLDGGTHWWDVEFFPIRANDQLLGILGRISPLPLESETAHATLPEKLVELRESMGRRYRLEEIDTNLVSMRQVADQARLAGATRSPVLIVGEPGTGKKFLARVIHEI